MTAPVSRRVLLTLLGLGVLPLAAGCGGDGAPPSLSEAGGASGTAGGSAAQDNAGGPSEAGGASDDPSAACPPGHGTCNLGMVIGCKETGTGDGNVSERCQSNGDCRPGLYCGTQGDMAGLCSVQCYPSKASMDAGCQVAADCPSFGFAACFGREAGTCALTCGKDEDCPVGSGCIEKTAWAGHYGLDNERVFKSVKVCAAL